MIYKAKAQAVSVSATIDGKDVIIPQCPIVGSGKGQSEGWLLIDGETFMYVPNIAPDVAAILDILADVVNKVGADIAPSNGGGAIAPHLAADMQAITLQIDQLKEQLI